ncbi:MAG: hypothetical protein HY741_25470 [Chloroflexi bacterium]|nr:hypothetical protein [Chloroflexota bacterium]
MSRSSPSLFFLRLEHVGVLAAYAVIALASSFPLITQFGDRIAGVDGDVWSYLWAMGWARVSVLNLGANPFHTDYVYYPLGGATQLLWGAALPSFASFPLQLAFGLAPTFNLVYLAASVVTGYGMYLLGKQEIGSWKLEVGNWKLEVGGWKLEVGNSKFGATNVKLAAFVAGVAFTFSALRLGYGLAFTNLFHTEFIPFYVLFLFKATRARGWKNALLAGFWFACNVYVDFQIAAFLALLTAVWFVFVAVRAIARDPKRLRRVGDLIRAEAKNPSGLLPRWLVMLTTAGILVLPMLGMVLNDFAIEGGNYIRVYPLKYSAERSYDAFAYFLPNARSALYQNLPAPKIENINASITTPDESEMSPDRQSFLGITLLALAIVGVIRFRRALWFWLSVTLVFALLSLGPVLHFAGTNTGIPMPFALINPIPILNNIRIPMRYGLIVFFGASMLAGAGAYVLLQWRRWLIAPILALLLVETAVLPYPTLEFHVPRVYAQIAQSPNDATVLEIPSFNWRYAAKNETYQVVHQKRILRAYTNRIAPDIAEYFNLRQTPIVVRSLRILEGAEKGVLTQEEIAQDHAVLEDTLAFFNLRYAVMHRDQLSAERITQIDAYLRDVLRAQVFYKDDTVTAYQFADSPAPKQTLALDLANNATLMYLGRGWQIEPLADADGTPGRYLESGASEIYLPQSALTRVELYLHSTRTNSEIRTQGNDKDVSTISTQQGWQTYPLALSLPNRLNLLRLVSNSGSDDLFALGALEIK